MYKVTQRVGVLYIDKDNCVNSFQENEDLDYGKINVGYMVLNLEGFDYIEGYFSIFEKEPLNQLAEDSQLKVFYHKGF